MNEGIERARDRRNILEKLGAKIPGFHGYLEREMRREVDKLQRDWLAAQVDRARFAMNAKIRDWTRKGRLENLDLAGSIEKGLDRLANRIRHADYGSSGFFDAVKIGEAELDRLYEFDLALAESVEYLALQVEQLPETADEQMLSRLLDSTEGADRKFDERATVFEDVTQKGGV
jgi:hypothetical protein